MHYRNYCKESINRLLTELARAVLGNIGPRSWRTATTSGQYSPVRPEQARLVSCLLYGTLFLIVKCTSGAINLFSFLSFSFLAFQSFHLSIFLASSGSFTVKNDNIHSFFFSLFWLQILNLPASLQNKNTRVGPFPWKRSVLQNPDRQRTNQSTGICLRLGLPCNNARYSVGRCRYIIGNEYN